MTNPAKPYDRQINHKTMRKIVGAIAFLLAPITYVLAGVDYPVNSISATYWTDSGPLFIGSLFAVGFFLAAYNGTGGRDLEFYISKAAALFAVCIALFPTISDRPISDQIPKQEPPAWVSSLTDAFGISPMHVHGAAAVLLFACLFAMMWFFSKRARAKNRPGRALAYKTIAVLMIAGMILVGLAVKFGLQRDDAILWVEVWGLSFFSFGWVLAGIYAEADNGTPSANL